MSRKPRHHILDPYGAHLYLCTTAKQWRAVRETVDILPEKPPEAAGAVNHFIWEPKHGRHVTVLVVWIDRGAAYDDADLIDTCAHEAYHAAVGLLHNIGHRNDDPTGDEAAAYLVGWVTAWLYEGVRS